MSMLFDYGAFLEVLLECEVPKEAISMMITHDSDVLAIKVKSSKGERVLNLSMREVAQDNQSALTKLVDLARWYHGGTIPFEPTLVERLVYHVKGCFYANPVLFSIVTSIWFLLLIKLVWIFVSRRFNEPQ